MPGPICTPEGRVIGEHVGLAFYTIGQRKGIGIGGVKGGGRDGEAWYVAGKDMAKNELVVVAGRDHPLLQSDSLARRRPFLDQRQRAGRDAGLCGQDALSAGRRPLPYRSRRGRFP